VNGTSFVGNLTDDTDCGNSGDTTVLPAFTNGDYFGSCVIGTGNGTTRFLTYQLDSLTDSECSGSICNPLDYTTWGTPACDITPTLSGGEEAYIDDTGSWGGLGVATGADFQTDLNDLFILDNFSVQAIGAPPTSRSYQGGAMDGGTLD